MAQEDRNKWNERYQAGSHGGRVVASVFLQDWLLASSSSISHRLFQPDSLAETAAAIPRVLDVACGTGRNAMYLAQAGFTVDAVDISSTGLDKARADVICSTAESPVDRGRSG